MSLFKSFSSYFYFFTPPHIMLLLLCVLMTISQAIPLTSSPLTANQFRNTNQLQLPSAVMPYRRANNNKDYIYGKNDELMGDAGFLDGNSVESIVRDIALNLPPPPLNAELEDINPLIPTKSDENQDVNDIINRIIESMTDEDLNQMDKNRFELLRKQIEKVKEEEDIQLKSQLLQQVLMNYPEGPLPIVYVEETKPIIDAPSVDKRSGRYYRRYPWKRQQKGKGSYDPDARFMCTPTRDEIFKLLVGLHETHKGNERRLVNFCNRRRPAKTVFTNIRFLG